MTSLDFKARGVIEEPEGYDGGCLAVMMEELKIRTIQERDHSSVVVQCDMTRLENSQLASSDWGSRNTDRMMQHRLVGWLVGEEFTETLGLVIL